MTYAVILLKPTTLLLWNYKNKLNGGNGSLKLVAVILDILQVELYIRINGFMGALKLIKQAFEPSFKQLTFMASITMVFFLYNLLTFFKLASKQMSTSVNRILYTRIWFEGWFEGGLKLILKCLPTNLNLVFSKGRLKVVLSWFDQFERILNSAILSKYATNFCYIVRLYCYKS